jgi:hypothetical protein
MRPAAIHLEHFFLLLLFFRILLFRQGEGEGLIDVNKRNVCKCECECEMEKLQFVARSPHSSPTTTPTLLGSIEAYQAIKT